jgi:hypothetical protein
MTPRQRTGRIVVCAIIVLYLLVDIGLSVWLATSNDRGYHPAKEVTRILITAVVLYCLWRGMNWAFWFTVVFSGARGLQTAGMGLLLTYGTPKATEGSPNELVAVGGFYLVIAAALLAFPGVQDFLLYQRKGPPKAEEPPFPPA